MDEEVKKGKKRTLESGEELGKKRTRSNATSTKKSTPQASRPDPPPTRSITSAASAGLPMETKKPVSESSTKTSTNEPMEVRPSPTGSKDYTSMGSKSRREKPSGTKAILKSSREVAEPTTTDVPAKEKHVKFAKTKKDKVLGVTDKKVRSGGGRGASAKDRVMSKKVAVK